MNTMKKMNKKKIQMIIIICLMLLLLFFSRTKNIKQNPIEKDSWNGGHCSIDGGRLHYVGSNNKEHYRCEICNKDYAFDKVMSFYEK